MARSVYAEVRARGRVDRDALAAAFAERCEPYRGYGAGTVVVRHEIGDGRPWAEAAGAVFDGAMAVAVAAGCAAATRESGCAPDELLWAVEPYLVDGRTAAGIRRAPAARADGRRGGV